MNISIDDRWSRYINDAVNAGRYGSAEDVVREGLRLLAEHEQRLDSLRKTIAESLARGGDFSDDEIGAALDAQADAWRSQNP